MQVSKRFDLCTASAFGDARLTLVHEDAAEFVKREVRQKSEPPYGTQLPKRNFRSVFGILTLVSVADVRRLYVRTVL